MNIVDGAKFISGSNYMIGITDSDYIEFLEFYENQVKPDPYSSVRDRGMIKLIYDRPNQTIRRNTNQNYFQSYSANDADGGNLRIFPLIGDDLMQNKIFLQALHYNSKYINVYCDRAKKLNLNISIHFIRYKAEEGGASFSSPIWLHVDDEPLVFIHLIQLTNNAIGADNVISGMDGKPSNVLRLSKPFDTLIVDPTKKHAVTPLGSNGGTAYRDVMLMNVEAEIQQK